MTRDELLGELAAERFGPLAQAERERPATFRRQQELVEALQPAAQPRDAHGRFVSKPRRP